MTDWSPLGRCRTVHAETKTQWGDWPTVSVAVLGRGLNMTMAEFAELLVDAELGKAMRAVDEARRKTGS